MEQQWRSILRPRLRSQTLSDKIAQGFADLASDGSEIGEVDEETTGHLENFCLQNVGRLSDEQMTHLRLTYDALQATKGNVKLVEALLSTNPDTTRLADAVYKHYSNPTSTSLDEGDNRALRLRLFETETTAVVAGLLYCGAISVASKEVQVLVAEVFHTAFSEGLDIRRQSILCLPQLINKLASIVLKKTVLQYVTAIQRLCAVVTDPLDLGILIGKNLQSAQAIALLEKNDFIGTVSGKGGSDNQTISKKAANAIWWQAYMVNLRNERAWADIIKQRDEIPVLAIDQSVYEDHKDHKDHKDQAKVSLETLFRESDCLECDEFSSVLSPAAYLVDLLQLLRYSYTDSETQIEPKKDKASSSPHLLERFLERRPDIAKLQLSKANTTTIVAYADLVNEVLEAYLSSLLPGSRGEIFGHNEADASVSSEGLIASSWSKTNWTVYKDLISLQITNIKHFPINVGRQASREYLAALGTSLYELYRLFAAYIVPQDIFVSQGPEHQHYQECLLASAIDRRLAAELLNLSHEDFVIITGEAFQSPLFLSEMKDQQGVFSREEYNKRIGLATVGEYWGYKSEHKVSMSEKAISADDKMVGKIEGVDGLMNVKEDLIPRSGLSFQEVLAVLKTEYIARRFVISVENKNGAYSGSLEDMRLCSPRIKQEGLETYLVKESCKSLLCFIRLWRALDWPLNDVDAAILTLANARLSGEPITQNFMIDPETILDLAAVKQLSDLSCIEIQRLLPLWGNMQVQGLDPLYQKLFGQAKLLKQYPTLRVSDSGEPLPGIKIADHLPPLSSVLQISASDFPSFAAAAGLTTQDDWTIENVSQIYRHSIICRILEISPAQYVLWASFNADFIDPYASPRTTLKVVERWLNLRSKGWSKDLLMKLAQSQERSAVLEYSTSDADLTAAVVALLAEFENTYSSGTSAAYLDNAEPSLTTGRLQAMCLVLFDAATSDKIVAMVEGSWNVTSICLKAPSIPSYISVARKVTIRGDSIKVHGILTDPELKQLIELAPTNQYWQSVVNKAYTAIRLPYDALSSCGILDIVGDDSYLLEPVSAADPVQAEQERSDRRESFIKAIVSTIRSKVTSESIISLIAAKITSVDRKTLTSLLKERFEGTQSGVALLQALLQKNRALLADISSDVSGYFIAPATDDYVFVGQAELDGVLMVDGRTCCITSENAKAVQLVRGHAYPIRLSTNTKMQCIHFSTSSGAQSQLSPECFAHEFIVRDVASIVGGLRIAADVVAKLKLSETELSYFSTEKINFFAPSLHALKRLQDHEDAKEMFQRRAKQSMVDFYDWRSDISKPPVTIGALAEQISRTTGLGSQQVEDVLTHLPSLAANTSSFDAAYLLRLYDTIDFSRKIPTALKSISYWSALVLPTDISRTYDMAKALEASLSTRDDTTAIKAREAFSATKRKVLVQYLMTKSKVGNTDIVDEDTLFEYFLLDVQMGPQLQTSRIKQAISTIQLFVQRCLLGLEKKNKIPTTAVKRSNWSWMSKFSTWQANRKVFLYPENWIDESIRDDKSETFRTIEAVILQSNLSLSSVNSIIRQYIYGVNEIADLQVQAYFWEAGPGFQGTYHLFGRTRTAPYKYYYRILQITGVKADDPQYNWYPWSRMDVEIPAQEVDWNGEALAKPGSYLVPSIYRGRLFLFIPQILLKSKPKTGGKDLTIWALRDQKPKDLECEQYWEIKMGWVEMRNGKWSKKEVSLPSVDVQGSKIPVTGVSDIPTQAAQMPSISSFHFRISSRSPPDIANNFTNRLGRDILIIDVTRWIDTGTNNYAQLHVGRFELRGTQMVVSDYRDSSSDLKHTVPTRFSRLDHSTKTTSLKELQAELKPFAQYDPKEEEDVQPLIALAPNLKEFDTNSSQDIIWTVSYNEAQHSGASALLVERTTVSRVDAYFGIPVRSSDGLPPEGQREVVSVQSLSHDVSKSLMEAATRTEDLESLYAILENVPFNKSYDAFGGAGDTIAKELARPNAIYNWELGFHLVLLLMERLLATQQFELALQISNLVFDLRADDETPDSSDTLSGGLTGIVEHETRTHGSIVENDKQTKRASSRPMGNLNRCWRFAPFKNSKLRLAGSTKKVVETLNRGHKTSIDVDDWLASPFNAHSIARGRPAVYMKRFIIKYVEILVAAGDTYFRENTLESIPLALQRYVEASQLFGKRPETLPRPTKPLTKTYQDIRDDLNDFSSAAVDMELQSPFFVEPSSRAVPEHKSTYNGVLGMVRSMYFPVPPNPQIAGLRDLIDDRFFKIRNSLDINGEFRRLALFEPPLDPGQLVRSMASGGITAVLARSTDGPMPNYRFLYLLQKAFEICAEVKSLADMYLSIKEKRDNEGLAALRARQDIAIQTLGLQMKQLQREDSLKTIEVLETTRKSHVMRLKYFLTLIGESIDKVPSAGTEWQDVQQAIEQPTKDELVMSPQENMEMTKLDEAEVLDDKATAIENACSVLKALPELEIEASPMGVGAATQFDASKVAEGMEMIASVIHQQAAARSSEASRASRKAQLIRQLQERRLQANQAGHDISNIDTQIEGQRIKLNMCDTDIKMQQQQIANVNEVEEYLRSKHTNEALYAWMDASACHILHQTYQLAMDAAKSAEKAFLFERGPLSSEGYLSSSYWDSTREGLFAAQNLYLGLKRIENAYHQSKSHNYELSKSISLRNVSPWSLLRLQETGKTEFVLPEVLFDYDFTGHYCRRIRSVAVTIPCIVGPYVNISCTLRLLEHGYRLRQQAIGLPYYPTSGIDADPRYATDKIPIAAVALSSCQQDSGTFELNFPTSERYGPFEGAGAVSRWSLELPTAIRQFDYRSISDVILQVQYTSRDGGARWQKAASDAVVAFQASVDEKMHTALFDLRDALLVSPGKQGVATAVLRDLPSQLPFWTRGKKVGFKQCWLVGTKGFRLLAKEGEEGMPSVNGKIMSDSSAKARGGDILMNETMAALSDKIDIVETEEDDSATGMLWTDFTVRIEGLKSGIDGLDAELLREDRLWLLVKYFQS